MQLADALIVATAVEYAETLCTANLKHYKVVTELSTRVFRPGLDR
jgi:predicted nucleic acid-binding protein